MNDPTKIGNPPKVENPILQPQNPPPPTLGPQIPPTNVPAPPNTSMAPTGIIVPPITPEDGEYAPLVRVEPVYITRTTPTLPAFCVGVAVGTLFVDGLSYLGSFPHF